VTSWAIIPAHEVSFTLFDLFMTYSFDLQAHLIAGTVIHHA
jgi:hypothetical protein